MKTVVILPFVLAIAGCGVETASTAASAAAMKKQEIEQGRATMERLQRDLDEANRQAAQRAAQAEEAGK